MKNKRAIVTFTSLCMLAAVSLIGFYNAGRNEEENYVDLSKVETPEHNPTEEDTKVNDTEEKTETAGGNVQAKNFSNAPQVQEQINETPQVQESPAANTTERIADFSFTEQDVLEWPVEGKVLMNYSMDQTIYFETLNQYKYNPAVLISSEVNTPVTAAARGRVVNISENEETGNTITVDIGNDYSLTYGQLKEVPLSVGSIVEKGDVIGYIGETTKYYSEEGSNLYFAMKYNNTTKNPLDFMDTELEE